MTMDRSYLNWGDGFSVCCWDAPSKEALEDLFKKAGTDFEKMFAVREHAVEQLVGS